MGYFRETALLTAPPPHARDEWIALRHLAVHWASHLEGIAGSVLATRLLWAIERGEVPASSVRIAADGSSCPIADAGGLRGLTEKAAGQGTPRLEFFDDLLEERELTLLIDRAGVILFAELYGYSPPPWWAPSRAQAGNEGNERGQRRQAGTWQRESCETAFAALYPGGIPDKAAKTNQTLIAEVEDYLKGSVGRAPSGDTILREAGRKPTRAGK